MDNKYSIYDKKKLMYNIKKINQQDIYYKIYDVIKNEDIEYTSNSNGIFFDFNKISNPGLNEIENFIDEYTNKTKEIDTSIEFIKYSTEEFEKINVKGSRLNNIEKQFLKYNKLN